MRSCIFSVIPLAFFTLAPAAYPQLPPALLQPNLRLVPARPDAPAPGIWNVNADQEESDGYVRKLHGHAEIEGNTLLFRADELEFNEDTGDLRATGHVYYHNFVKNEQIWADHIEYNTKEETGKFYSGDTSKMHGETTPRINSRPGILTTNNPFYFEADWAERIGDKYVVHDGYITNCKVPSPWWTLRGPKFDVIPGERALAYRSVFRIRGIPLFFTPFFYKSLEREPRKSGFLLPSVGNSSIRGIMLGVGYFWAINRSYDVTYRFTDFTSRGTAHHVDFRGKPRPGTDYDTIIYGVQDRGQQNGSGPAISYGGASVWAAGKSDLGDGWNVRGQINYITSFAFRQNWSESFNEAIGSEVQSAGYVNKSWSDYTFNVVASRLENYQSPEVTVTDPVTQATHLETNAILIRKLPEAQFGEREHQIWKNVPVWFSFDSAAGLLYREEPLFQNGVLIDHYQTGEFMNRVNFAPHLMTAFHWKDFHLIPRFGIQETYYSESQALDTATSALLNDNIYRVIGTNLVRSSRDFSADLIFPTLARVYNKKTIFGDKLKHVIEPRVSYRYVAGIGDDFGRFIRFDETDILANTNELQLSLTNRLYAKRGDTVSEVFSWQLWQTRYFDPTFGGALVPGQNNVFLSTETLSPFAFLVTPRSSSPIVSVMRTTLVNRFSVDWRADYDLRLRQLVDSTVSLDYRLRKYFLSVGHNLVHTDPILTTPADQFHFRAGFGDPNHRGWNAGTDAVYDRRLGYFAYATTQVTYNTDCCGLSVQWRRFAFGTRNENQFRVAFAISNIGTFGTLRKQDRMF